MFETGRRPVEVAMRRLLVSAGLVVALALVIAGSPLGAQSAPKRPMTVGDVVAFKSLGVTSLSPDGQWLAYRMSPQEGDAEVTVRSTTTDKSWTFPVGQSGGGITFSDDSAWVGITTSATKREADTARRANRPAAQPGVTLLNLSTGEKTPFPKIRRIAFNGEMGGWVALYRAAAEGAGRGAAPAPGRAGGAPGGGTPSTAPKGADLVLHDLKTGIELNIGNVSEFAFNKSGKQLALVIDATDQVGNGVELRDMTTGAIAPLDMDKAFFERLSWTDDGDALTVMRGHDDRGWKERQYAIDGFTGLNAGAPKKVTFDPAKVEAFPKGMAVSSNRAPRWTDARDAIVFGIVNLTKVERPAGARGAGAAAGEDAAEAPAGGAGAGGPEAGAPDPADRPDLVIWHYKDPRLQSQQQVQEAIDRQYAYASIFHVADGKFVRLADDNLRSVSLLDKDAFAIGNDNRAYELDGNITGRSFSDVYQIDAATGERKLLKKQVRWPEGGSPDGAHWAYYENRNVFVVDLETGAAHNITQGLPFSVVNTEDDHNVVDPPRGAVGWTSDSAAMLLTDGWDIWKVPVDGAAAVNLTVNGKKDSIRYRGRVRVDPDEKGVDLSKPQYFSAMAEWTKKQGYVVLDPGKTGVTPLLWDDASFGRLSKAKKSDTWIYSRETPTMAPEIFTTNARLANGRQLTHMQAEVDPFLWTAGSQLIDFTNAKGERLQASLHLPANYEKGRQYPTIVYIYERLTQGHDSFPRPSVPGTGFNIGYYTSNGYAVLEPDIKYYVNDPGMSAVWALVPAVKAAVATGVVDPKRVALHGHSWGGYQTAFTVTQTDIFVAAAAGAPLTDMISMYSLIYKNSGGVNGAIFESNQGRFTGPPLELWDAYTRNSPVRWAANVKTPLMILSNDKDGAVDFTQGIEYYDTLRRLGKPVVLLEYPGENHGLAKLPNMRDYMERMKEFFDHYLMAQPAPEWLENGIPLSKMSQHIDDRLKKDVKPAPAPAAPKGGGGV
jgi:dipeptidyl aminopeptidase/acylaminoacyl peptidase